MRVARLAVPLALLAVVLASSSSAATQGPTGLHGFLLSANEPVTHTFHETPSFAWSPVAGASHYELQIKTGGDSQENGVVYDDPTLQMPVAAPTVTLPWVNGSLYARVRAVFAGGGASPWSAPFQFDVVAPSAPAPLPSYSGLLRWTTVDGADAYEVWLLDKVKNQIEVTRSNVLDERDFYGSGSWPSAVDWRVRAMRTDVGGRQDGMPAASYGPWSKAFRTTNSAPSTGPIQLVGTDSDVFASGASLAHALMPGFLWSGNVTDGGVVAPYFRVDVFTDAQCLNRVYASPAVASPAYAPRISGLDLPAGQNTNVYLDSGAPTVDTGADGEMITANEQLAPAAPTLSLSTVSQSTTQPTTSQSTTSQPSGGATSAAGVVGPPVDLWDVNGNPNAPSGGYYWTVVGVTEVSQGVFRDLELPQQVCSEGRVQRLSISSTPSLTNGQAPYATGLSAKGRLITSARRARFYGQPLVAWTTASGASVYEVQWSPNLRSFASPSASANTAQALLTFSTSAILPLRPGTWYYRVRGFDFNLPAGSQQMAWSTPQRVVVAKPTYRIASVGRKQTLRVQRRG